MVFAHLSRLFMAAALVLALISVGIYVRPRPGRADTSIRPAAVNVDMKEVEAHARTPFEFTLTNGGSRPWKVTGTPSHCTKVGCVWALEPPAAIPPNQSVTFRFLSQFEEPGPIELGTAIYLEADPGEGLTIPLTFRGSVKVPSPGKLNPPEDGPG